MTQCSMLNYSVRCNKENHSFEVFLWCLWMIVSSGAVSIWRGSGMLTSLINLIWVAYFLVRKNPFKVNKHHIVLCITSVIVLLLHFVVLFSEGYAWSGTLHVISVVLMCYFATEKIAVGDVVRHYCRIVEIIAVLSLITYVLQPFILEYRHVLPSRVTVNTVSRTVSNYTNVYIALLRWEGVQRNQAMFWEPGAYQIFLNIALMFELFVFQRDKKTTIRLMVLIIAIATTLSTAGILNMCVLFGAYAFAHGLAQRNQNLVWIVIVAGIGWMLFGDAVISSIEFKFGVDTGVASDSVTSRIQPFLMDIRMMVTKPLGVGIDRYAIVLEQMKAKEGVEFVSSSCTQTVLGASFGIIAFIFVMCGSWGLSRKIVSSLLSSILVFVVLVLFFSTESFVYYPLFYYLVFSGVCTENTDWRL